MPICCHYTSGMLCSPQCDHKLPVLSGGTPFLGDAAFPQMEQCVDCAYPQRLHEYIPTSTSFPVQFLVVVFHLVRRLSRIWAILQPRRWSLPRRGMGKMTTVRHHRLLLHQDKEWHNRIRSCCHHHQIVKNLYNFNKFSSLILPVVLLSVNCEVLLQLRLELA